MIHITGGDASVGTIHMIRHGQASAHAVDDDLLESDYDTLTPAGLGQAHLVGSKLAHIVRPNEEVTLCSGPLSRQIDTARAIAEQLAQAGIVPSISSAQQDRTQPDSNIVCHVDQGWAEYPLEILRDHMARRNKGESLVHTISSALKQWTTSGDRSFEMFTQAVLSSFRDAISKSTPNSRYIIATSGGPIGLCTAYALDLPAGSWVDFATRIPNGSITTFHVRNGVAGLSTFNDYSHFQMRRKDDMLRHHSDALSQTTYL